MSILCELPIFLFLELLCFNSLKITHTTSALYPKKPDRKNLQFLTPRTLYSPERHTANSKTPYSKNGFKKYTIDLTEICVLKYITPLSVVRFFV